MRPNAFSLVETLIVVAIIGLLATLAVNSLASLSRASDVGTAAQLFAAHITQARQLAAARSEPVQLRIFHLPADKSGGPKSWRGIQLTGANGAALGRALEFPNRSILLPGQSPLLAGLATGTAQFPGLGSALHDCRILTFRPNGRVQTQSPPSTSSQWYFTIANADAPLSADGLPGNFAAIAVNPHTAQVSILRP